MTIPFSRGAVIMALAAGAMLAACGGGGGGSDSASPQPEISSATNEQARYGDPILFTLQGANLDRGLVATATTTGCRDLALQTSAPTVSNATTAYFRCNVTAVGNQTVRFTRSDGTVLRELSFLVLAPRVTLALDNGAGFSGNVTITLSPTEAPVTVNNFLAYVKSGFYDGTVFHRFSPGFVVQGGGYAAPVAPGPTLPPLKPTNAPIVLEDNAGLSNLRLTVAMARTNAPDTATSQFFINLADNLFLNRSGSTRGYAVFGNVTNGADVVNAIAGLPCVTGFGANPAGDCLPSPNLRIVTARQTQ
jgi:cyclophilin family peptidyl-prolyl cis-trans isomerase